MKCECCPASRESNTESGYDWSCCAGFEEEIIEFKGGSCGCRHKRETVERAIEQYYASFEISDEEWEALCREHEKEQRE